MNHLDGAQFDQRFDELPRDAPQHTVGDGVILGVVLRSHMGLNRTVSREPSSMYSSTMFTDPFPKKNPSLCTILPVRPKEHPDYSTVFDLSKQSFSFTSCSRFLRCITDIV